MPTLYDLYRLVTKVEQKETAHRKFMENLMTPKKQQNAKPDEDKKPAKKRWSWGKKRAEVDKK
jgi:hypothetical protein